MSYTYMFVKSAIVWLAQFVQTLDKPPRAAMIPMGVAKNGEGTLGWLRGRNRERVLGALRERGRISQADIARITGLSRTTVHTLVAELKDLGVLREVEAGVPDFRGGRPSVLLMLRESSLAVVGIDFGHSHVGVAVADIGHNVLAERRCDLDVSHDARAALDAAARMVDEVLTEARVERKSVIGAGIGIPGPIDRARGTAGSATILPGWIGVPIGDEMHDRLGMPVEIENDANLGALAELTWGAGRECSNFVYVKVSTGIGAGLVIDGKVLRGATGTAGEIGHTTLDESGALCYCGNRGCLETVASGPAIIQLVGPLNGEVPTLARIVELAVAGEVRCHRAISDAGHEIGIAIAGLCNLINPERVIVGGLVSRTGEVLLQPMRESIRRHALLAVAETLDVRPAVFVERAELLGSLALALQGSSDRMSKAAEA
ncbi:MAG TPA: ROK family transcriptional regulator [Candidatus Dormibacteraeota bacterium]|jgi:predicted NBD/HSP70 family sugar kinase|nr:ROK family transcriptional regulator [Candidatus Dormibacteraeota bacterium]